MVDVLIVTQTQLPKLIPTPRVQRHPTSIQPHVYIDPASSTMANVYHFESVPK